MTERYREPQRLRETDASLRRLLESARGDNPSRATLRAAPVAITGLISAHATSASAASAAGVAAAGVKTSVVGIALVGKWVGFGLLAGAALSVGASATLPARESAPRADRLTTAPTIQAQAPNRAPIASPPVAPIALPTASVAESAERPRLEPSHSEPKSDLAREIALLDAAGRALNQRDPARTLQLLDSGRALPSRALIPEATVLRVRALLQLQRRDDAERVVEDFARSAPRSPQLAVLRGLVHPSKIP